MKIAVDQQRLMRELDALAAITDCPQLTDPSLPQPQRAVTRVVFTARDLEARQWLRELATEAGLLVRDDAVGNTFFRWQGSDPSLPAVGTGSHIDAIPYAGMYDGTAGVLGGLEAIRALQACGFQPRLSIELVLFTSEEPTRFGVGCLGSRLLSGKLDPEAADALPDRLHETDPTAPAGGTLASVRRAAGFDGDLGTVARPGPTYAAWIELHIEQGPLLEQSGDDLGIVTHIAGPASYRFTMQGIGGHAGALLMPDRRDALCAAAELVLAVERAALEANAASGESQDSVATVGKLDLYPAAVNAVPSRVQLMLDIRDTDPRRRNTMMDIIRSAARAIEGHRGVTLSEELINADDPVSCDPELVHLLERMAAGRGYSTRRLVSRAYHDTTFMARVAPVAMVFVPCRGGVSHRADEYVAPAALARGVEVLAETMAALAGAGELVTTPVTGGVD